MEPATLLPDVLRLARDAGRAVLRVYRGPDRVRADTKRDGSPVTRADLLAHRTLVEGLERLTPGWPVVSEDAAGEVFDRGAAWGRYWLIDPLDGVREFVARNPEFSVNVALIAAGEDDAPARGRAVLGVVVLPALGLAYGGVDGAGAWRWRTSEGGEEGPAEAIRTRAPAAGEPARVLVSRSHRAPEEDAFVDGLAARVGRVERDAHGSSLKLCRLAEGAAHYYPRLTPTHEWDTAAAQAVLEAAGGVMWRFGARTPVRYGKPGRENPGFLATYGPDAPLPDAYLSSDGH